jgi:uncharacterized protein VirK/YbjX
MLIPIKLNWSLFAPISAALKSFVLMRRLGVDRLRPSLARIRKGAWLAMHPLTCIRVAKVFMPAETQPVVQADPRVMFKYLGHYVALGLSRQERAAILIDHYAFLKARVERNFFRTMIDGRLELWRQGVSQHLYRICMAFSRKANDEGDLSLIFEADHVDICTLSFTIGPGVTADLAWRVLYIARVQGRGESLHLIRAATKNCCDVSPAAILLAAAEGIATALELRHMVGIGASNQISKDLAPQQGMVKAYDEFWMTAGGIKLARDMYHLPVPSLSKPIQSIKRNHRPRTLRKREYKKLVTEQICCAFRAVALRQLPIALDRTACSHSLSKAGSTLLALDGGGVVLQDRIGRYSPPTHLGVR